MSTRREIAVPFVCSRSGDCCRETTDVRMSQQERAEILKLDPDAAHLTWRDDDDPNFTRLAAAPCPFLTHEGCRVYEARPLVCRQFLCGRPDVVKETYDVDFITGCGNLTARLEESRRFREHYATNARKTLQTWGRRMGY